MLHPVAAEIIEMIEEIEARNLGPEELVVAMRELCEKMSANADVERQLPAGLADSVRTACDALELSNARTKEAERRMEIAYQNRQITRAKFDRLADQLLDNQDDRKKGN